MAAERASIVFGVTIDYQLRYHQGLYERLAEAGWDVHIVAGTGPIGGTLSEYPGVTVHVLDLARTPSPSADFRGLIWWLRLLRRWRPDVVVVGTPKAGLIGILAARLTRVPVRVYELHGLRLESTNGLRRSLLRAMERITCAASTHVIAVGSSLRERALSERLVAARKVVVIGTGSSNGVDVDRFAVASSDEEARISLRAALGIPSSASIVTFVGRLTADKGLRALTDAMVEVERQAPVWLLLIGGIDDESGLDEARHLRETLPRVSVVGEVDDVAPFLAISDVLCLPSRREGLPTVILEAFAAGVPVVATRATGIVDLVSDGVTGRLAPIDDVPALGQRLLEALQDTAASNRMAAAASRFVAANFVRDEVQTLWIDTVGRMRVGHEY